MNWNDCLNQELFNIKINNKIYGIVIKNFMKMINNELYINIILYILCIFKKVIFYEKK